MECFVVVDQGFVDQVKGSGVKAVEVTIFNKKKLLEVASLKQDVSLEEIATDLKKRGLAIFRLVTTG